MLAAALFAGIFLLRHLFGTPADGLTFLYVLPICLLGSAYGVRSGLGGGLLALGLFALWDQIDAQDQTALAYCTRAVAFLGVGGFCGVMADRVRAYSRDSDRYFEQSSQMLGIFDLDGRPVRLNERWSQTLGWTSDQLMAMSPEELVHPDDRARLGALLGDMARGRQPAEPNQALRLLAADGSARDIALSIAVHGAEKRVYLSGTDVTEWHELEAARRQAEERFRVAFEDSATGMAVVALAEAGSGYIVEANAELARILGRPRGELLGAAGIVDFIDPSDRDRLRAEMSALAEGKRDVVRSEIRIVRPDGPPRWIHVTSSLLHDDDGRPIFRLSQVLDIDARRRVDEKVRYLADHDPVSGLLNRRRFVDDPEQEVASHPASRGSILVVDLDQFKRVNDTAGHAVGDAVIAAVGDGLTQRLRSGDLAARMGGDEFAVLLRRTDRDQALAVARELTRSVEAELAALPHPVARAVSLSVGVADLDGSSADQVLARADRAMYAAKREGGARVRTAAAAEAAETAS